MQLHPRRHWKLFLTAASLLFSVMIGPTQAAQFAVDPSGDITVITIIGTLIASDDQKFADTVTDIHKAVVLFASNGGSVVAGLRIGKLIRLRSFMTAVPDGVLCASACALAWLGGTSRFMGADAKIGFHAAYSVENGTPAESGVANALVGSYLHSLGLSDEAVVYATLAHPEEIRWLTLADAQKIGIDVALLPPLPPTSAPRAAPPATQYPIQPPAPPVSATLEQAAQRFLENYFGRWSENNATAMAYIDGLYADRVDFYGAITPRQTIVDLKRKFVERWPDRLYTVRPNSVRIDCNQQDASCVISGLVDWDCRSLSRGARSAGLANFSVRVAFGKPGIAQVVMESGSVVSRSIPQ